MEGDTLAITIYGDPMVKKNSATQVAFTTKTGKRSYTKITTASYQRWLSNAQLQFLTREIRLKRPSEPIDFEVILDIKFYLKTNRIVDMSALYEGIQDVLVKERWLLDDNRRIVVGHDGSRSYVDKHNPRMDITIRRVK